MREMKAWVWSLWTTSVHKSISKAKVWLDIFAFLVSLIIFRRVFIKLCQLQFWFVILICAHPFLHQQVEVEMRFKVRAKTQVHARNTNFSMNFLDKLLKTPTRAPSLRASKLFFSAPRNCSARSENWNISTLDLKQTECLWRADQCHLFWSFCEELLQTLLLSHYVHAWLKPAVWLRAILTLEHISWSFCQWECIRNLPSRMRFYSWRAKYSTGNWSW